MAGGADWGGDEYLLPTMTTEEHLAGLRGRLLTSRAAGGAGSLVGWAAAPGGLRRFAGGGGPPLVVRLPWRAV
ncbi:MAG: hypothetical protein DIU83_06015, partial [Bacillota bacterium]